MNMQEVDKTMDNVFNYLDTLELMPYIIEFNNKDIYDLMERLEELFPFKDEYSECLFDAIACDEFADYLNKRYNLNIREYQVSYFNIRL